MYPLSAIARTFNRNTTTLPKLSSHSHTPITISFLANQNIHLAKYSNNDNDIEHFEPEIAGYTDKTNITNKSSNKSSSNITMNIFDDESYLAPYLV